MIEYAQKDLCKYTLYTYPQDITVVKNRKYLYGDSGNGAECDYGKIELYVYSIYSIIQGALGSIVDSNPLFSSWRSSKKDPTCGDFYYDRVGRTISGSIMGIGDPDSLLSDEDEGIHHGGQDFLSWPSVCIGITTQAVKLYIDQDRDDNIKYFHGTPMCVIQVADPELGNKVAGAVLKSFRDQLKGKHDTLRAEAKELKALLRRGFAGLV